MDEEFIEGRDLAEEQYLADFDRPSAFVIQEEGNVGAEVFYAHQIDFC